MEAANRRSHVLSTRPSPSRRSRRYSCILAVRLMVFVLAPLSEAFAHSFFFGTRLAVARGGSSETMDPRQQRQSLTCVMQAPPPITSNLMNNNEDNNGKKNKKTPPSAVRRTPKVEFVAETRLPTDLGEFRLRAYRVGSHEPCVIYSADHPLPLKANAISSTPVRVHDQCMTSEVFRSQR